jgi:CMP-N-acetylneuraminic acid synthetase
MGNIVYTLAEKKMLDGNKILAVIPARGGSKGVPRKNIRPLAGKPLIAWTIEEAKKSKYIDQLVLSSEDAEIIKIAQSYECEVPFVRPIELAQDDTPGIDPILHAIEQLPGYNIVILLQPTSPLRTVQDIDAGLEFFMTHQAHVCVSVSETTKSPYWMFSLSKNFRVHSLLEKPTKALRRQDLPKSYVANGALFIARTDYLNKQQSFYTQDTLGYVMPRERAYDIDEELDFVVCESVWSNFIK